MHRHLKIVCHPHESLRWVFDGKPRLRLEKPNDWTTDQVVDPTPCYPHDIKVVRETLDRCTQAFTPLSRIWIHLLSFELESRTNGHAERSWDHDWEKNKKPSGGVIVLQGKRIPPHPATTRYLAAHEYGHHVQWWIEFNMGLKPDDLKTFRDDYAKMRRLKTQKHYGPGTWHKSIGEIVANDFRILGAGVETEFWPHPGITHPKKLKTVQKWWEDHL